MPSADTEFLGTQYRVNADLGGFTQFRWGVHVVVAGAAGADLRLQYSTDGGTAWTNLDGAAGPELVIDTVGTKVSAWTALPAGAQTAVLLRIMGKDGNGTADPQFRNVWVQFKS